LRTISLSVAVTPLFVCRPDLGSRLTGFYINLVFLGHCKGEW
jgi:hypothetical protein